MTIFPCPRELQWQVSQFNTSRLEFRSAPVRALWLLLSSWSLVMEPALPDCADPWPWSLGAVSLSSAEAGDGGPVWIRSWSSASGCLQSGTQHEGKLVVINGHMPLMRSLLDFQLAEGALLWDGNIAVTGSLRDITSSPCCPSSCNHPTESVPGGDGKPRLFPLMGLSFMLRRKGTSTLMLLKGGKA